MNTKFLVITSQRTGSTYLTTLLDSHPHVLCPGEILFRRAGNKYAISAYMRNDKVRMYDYYLRRGLFLNKFLDAFYGQPGYESIGFKLMFGQVRWFPYRFPSVVDYVKSRELHVIHNIRRNYLRVHLSRKRARSSGVYHVSQKNTSRNQMAVNTKSLLLDLQRMREEDYKWEKRFETLPYIKVEYEALTRNPEIQTDRLLSFLSVKGRSELKTDFVRLNPEGLKSIVSNYEEVCSILTGTEFEYCLREDG